MPVARTQRLSGGPHAHALRRHAVDAELSALPRRRRFRARHARRGRRRTRRRRAPRRRPRAQYALQAGEESLRYYTEYFGIRYPLPKLDMIGVPGAGGFGAMENWGAILYFDQYLLVDDDRSSEADRQTVFGIVAHEIAHQWFGNLVTMKWWDDLWLNEGFASWMAAKAIEARASRLAALAGAADRRHRRRAMALDARDGTHPIVQTVNTIDEANLAFDDITYEKGLAVIRMLEAYVGEDGFRQRRARLSERAPLRQRADGRSVARGASGVRPAGAGDRAQLHRRSRAFRC